MKSPTDLNNAILDALGIECRGGLTTRVQIDIQADKSPTATITQPVPDPKGGVKVNWTTGTLETKTETLTGHARGFGLDAACKTAMHQVRKTINAAADAAVIHIATGFIESRRKLGLPLALPYLNLSDDETGIGAVA